MNIGVALFPIPRSRYVLYNVFDAGECQENNRSREARGERVRQNEREREGGGGNAAAIAYSLGAQTKKKPEALWILEFSEEQRKYENCSYVSYRLLLFFLDRFYFFFISSLLSHSQFMWL